MVEIYAYVRHWMTYFIIETRKETEVISWGGSRNGLGLVARVNMTLLKASARGFSNLT